MNNELAAFGSFKFKLGEMVTHVSDDAPAPQGIVGERMLLQTPAGIERFYVVSFRASETVVREMELEPWQRPVRM